MYIWQQHLTESKSILIFSHSIFFLVNREGTFDAVKWRKFILKTIANFFNFDYEERVDLRTAKPFDYFLLLVNSSYSSHNSITTINYGLIILLIFRVHCPSSFAEHKCIYIYVPEFV